MAYLEYPKSDLKRSEFLNQSENTALKDKELNVIYLPETVVGELTAMRPKFKALFDRVNTSLTDREKEVREKNQSLDLLHTYVRDFWAVAKRRAVRMNQPVEILRNYGLPLSGETPKLSSEKEIYAAATLIIAGDAKAVADGHPAMTNPSAEEITAQLAAARKEKSEVAPADRAYNIFQKDLNNMREPVDELIREVADCLLFALRKETDSNKRRIMRTYGFEYRYLKGEAQDEEEVVAETTENE